VTGTHLEPRLDLHLAGLIITCPKITCRKALPNAV